MISNPLTQREAQSWLMDFCMAAYFFDSYGLPRGVDLSHSLLKRKPVGSICWFGVQFPVPNFGQVDCHHIAERLGWLLCCS